MLVFLQEFAKPEAPAPVATSSVNKELLTDLKHEMWKLMKVGSAEILSGHSLLNGHVAKSRKFHNTIRR